jgi:hypothetical protein
LAGLACRVGGLTNGTAWLNGLLGGAADALGGFGGRAARPDRLLGSTADLVNRFSCHASRPEGLPAHLAERIDRLADGAAGPERLLCSVADVVDCGIDSLEQGLQHLGIAVQRRQGPVKDVVQVLEPDLHQRFRLDVFDVELDLADTYMHAGDDLYQICDFGSQ